MGLLSTGIGSYLFLGGALGQSPYVLPYDLAAAIVARFAATPALSGAFSTIDHTQAGVKASVTSGPYLVFKVPSGTLLRTTSTSHFSDVRVRFDAFAASQERADALGQAVHDAYNKQPFAYQSGYSIPFVQVDRTSGRLPSRGQGAVAVFRSTVVFSARCWKAA